MQVKAIRIQGSLETFAEVRRGSMTKAIDYLQDRQNNPIIQNLSMHRLGRRPRKASDLLAVPRYRHEEDRTVIATAHPDPLHLPRRSGQDCQGAVEGALESPGQPTLIHRAMTGSYILAP